MPGAWKADPSTKYNLIGVRTTQSGVVTGAVESVDAASRAAVVKGSSGMRYGVKAGNKVQNFEQIHVDDVITADYYRQATFWVQKGGKAAVKPQVVEAMVAGSQPKDLVDAAEVKAVGSATVDSVDSATGIVVFKTPDGKAYPVKVENPIVVAGLAPGQVVDYEVTEAAATNIQVFPKPAPPPPPPPPVHQHAKLVAKKIEITETVYFATDKAVIEPRSYGLLDEVAAVIQENPSIKKFRIEGNTSKDPNSVKRGKAGYEFNMKLSQDRADAVKKYLTDKGVDPARLDTIGYGWNQPVAPNKTAAERAKNRRVDFVVVDQ